MNRVVLYRLVCACNIAGIAGAVEKKDVVNRNTSWITKKRLIVSAGVGVAVLAMIRYMKKELDIRAKALDARIRMRENTKQVFNHVLQCYLRTDVARDIPAIAEELMQGINFEEAAKIQDGFCSFILKKWVINYNVRAGAPYETDADFKKYTYQLGLMFSLLAHIQNRHIYDNVLNRTTSDDVIANRLALVLFVLIMVKNFQLFYANDMEINRNNRAYIEKINAFLLLGDENIMRLSAKQMNTLRAIADQYCSNETRKEEFYGITWTFAAGISGLDKVFTLSKPVLLIAD